VRNRVTDPYSISLGTDSERSYIGYLARRALNHRLDPDAAPALAAPTDMVVYELHSARLLDRRPSVPRPTAASTSHSPTTRRRHAPPDALASAGVTDLHLLPVFDIASIPESRLRHAEVPTRTARQPGAASRGDAHAKDDCFNWGYDPLHYSAPEGSYAAIARTARSASSSSARWSRPAPRRPAGRHGRGLQPHRRSGQHDKSVLDRIVPGYYHRLDATGKVETSTCCDNTATEHR
jgi:pullulanase/glycogen debranching enzyme